MAVLVQPMAAVIDLCVQQATRFKGTSAKQFDHTLCIIFMQRVVKIFVY